MKRLMIALTACACLARPALAADPIGYTAPDGVNTVPVTAQKPLPVADAGASSNNAPYSVSTVLTVGGAALSTPTRGVAADCAAGGAVTLTMSGSGTLTWTVAQGHQNQPYSITAVTASTATCSFYGLN